MLVPSSATRPGSSGHVQARHQPAASHRPSTTPKRATSEVASSSLSPAERTAMQQVVASRLKSMARSLRLATPPQEHSSGHTGQSEPDRKPGLPSSWSDVSQAAQQPQSAHLVGWTRAAAQHQQQPDRRRLEQLQCHQRPSTSASMQPANARPDRGTDHNLSARPSTSAGQMGGADTGSCAHARSHARLMRSYDSALGAPQPRQTAPLYTSARAIASAKPPPPPGISATAAGYGGTAESGHLGWPSRATHVSKLFGETRRTARITTSMLVDGSTRAAAQRPSRGTVLSVFEDLDAHGEGRVTFSTFEQAAVAVGMKQSQMQRLFSRCGSLQALKAAVPEQHTCP